MGRATAKLYHQHPGRGRFGSSFELWNVFGLYQLANWQAAALMVLWGSEKQICDFEVTHLNLRAKGV